MLQEKKALAALAEQLVQREILAILDLLVQLVLKVFQVLRLLWVALAQLALKVLQAKLVLQVQ